MKLSFSNFTRTHLRVLIGFYATFVVLSFLVMLPGALSGHGASLGTAVITSFGSISGPFAGAIARDFQRCCLRASMDLFPYCALILGIGVLFQFLPLPFQRFARGLRIGMWCFGLIGWFGGVILSFGHALS